jgi:hypothetical protein
MSLDSILTTANQFIPVIGLGGVGAIGIALWRGGFASGQRKKEVDQLIIDVKAIKGTIQDGGLKDVIGDIQVKCAGEMADLKRDLADHKTQPGHGDVPQRVSALEAKVGSLEAGTK